VGLQQKMTACSTDFLTWQLLSAIAERRYTGSTSQHIYVFTRQHFIVHNFTGHPAKSIAVLTYMLPAVVWAAHVQL
jgi:hypothetical protein